MNNYRRQTIIILSILTVSMAHSGEKVLRQGNLGLINPLLECADDTRFHLLLPFKYKIQKFITSKSLGKISHVSVYFRDLNGGPAFGINEDENFTPASLLKVPLMMCYFERAEFDPGILQVQLKYTADAGTNSDQNFKPKEKLTVGQIYTVEELIFRMVSYSDNEAANLLDENTDDGYKMQTYRDLGIEIPGVRGREDFMSVKEYSSFFRILYNASYLGKRMSNKALEILSKSEFHDGLEKGVPAGTVVAHKFGEKKYVDGATNQILGIQLHDCGIIYHPVKPYLLSIMTRGDKFEDMSKVIAEISKMVYDEVENQVKNSKK